MTKQILTWLTRVSMLLLTLISPLISTLALSSNAFAADTKPLNWHPYPSELVQLDYSGDALEKAWPQLSAGNFAEFPSAENLRDQAQRYPKLLAYLHNHIKESAHPALTAALNDDFAPLAEVIQQVWRLHYQGQFQQAYELGLELGPPGLVPALYAQLMHNALLEPDPDVRLQVYRQVSQRSEQLLPLVPDFAFAQFGLAYAHARELELLSTPQAAATGYLSQTRDTLDQLQQRFPERAMYPAMLGGLHAGVVGRVGSWIGGLTYGSSEDGANREFNRALALQNQQQLMLPVVLFEHAKALTRIDADDYAKQIRQTLEQCAQLTVYSAEEALNQQACKNSLLELNAVASD